MIANEHITNIVPDENTVNALTAPCFVADAALGRLTKWLRLAGFDTAYDPKLSFKRAKFHIAAGKTLLTRKYAIYNTLKEDSVIYIRSDHYLEQIKEVIRETGLDSKHLMPFSRCTQCNLSTVTVSRAEAFGRVPDYIWEKCDTFHICNGCQRIYWRGSHTANILTVLRCF